ncbi:MAG: rhomboid family intramembrane serine protease [Candidatus Cloacimonadota bacterium]|nr:MAG: rhomboid family intramembrane serine protease [Candidatus Cloacimonadota bacterium]
MIPLKDNNPTRTFPFITIAFISLNIVFFLFELGQGENIETFVRSFGCTPYEITTGTDKEPFIFFPVRLTIFTSMFLHGGWMHLIGNMLYLWIFGNNIEDRLGHLRFIFFYLLAGIIATFAQIIISPFSTIPQIGASGAVSGILGAYILLFPRAKVLTLIPLFYFIRIISLPAFVVLGFWIVLQIINGFTSLSLSAQGGIAFFAHIGGFLAGLLFVKPFLIGRRKL